MADFRFNFGAAEEENGSGDGNGADGSGSEGKKVFVKAEVLSPSLSECAAAIPSKTMTFGSSSTGVVSMKVAVFNQDKLRGDSKLNTILEDSDLEPAVYEGGFKLWECAGDLIVHFEATEYDFGSKSVLDLGCGHGLPGVMALQRNAKKVGFQDLNSEVLEHVTIPNVIENTGKLSQKASFVAGDWNDPKLVEILGASEWDLILTSDTLYSLESIPALVACVEKLLSPSGECYVGAKRYYFGVGGGVIDLMEHINESLTLKAEIVKVIDDGKSNLREIVRIVHKHTSSTKDDENPLTIEQSVPSSGKSSSDNTTSKKQKTR